MTISDPMAAANLYRLAFGFIPAQMIHVAARLGLPDALADEDLPAAELARRTGAHAPSLRRLLRGLASLGLVEETGAGTFRLTPAGAPLRADVPGSVRPMLMPYFSQGVWASWGRLLDSVRTGEPAVESVTGGSVFSHFAAEPELAAEFNAAMAVSAGMEAQAIARLYDFTGVDTVVDVGGGSGALLAGVLEHRPAVRGVLVDTASGVSGAPAVLEAAGVADRCEVAPGDFFDSVPAGGDLYVVKSVLHDWDDESCVRILRNCREAMEDTARILVVEVVAPPVVDTATDPFLAVSDLNLLVLTRGRERTEEEFTRLLEAAGLRLTRIGDPVGFNGYRMIEAAPAAAEDGDV
ncbi:methyltransferase [Streptomyces sp. NPDC006670]|uniref:methyltransferase n=1 Tax=Streptomyces sp. NPDC006670 TaxID=3154476 RepID=UPI0033D8EF01